MAAILRSIHRFEAQFDRGTQHFALIHPYLAFLVMFIGMPIFILIVVVTCTTLIVFPIEWIFGWL